MEFWRMISEQNVATMVMLSDVGDGQSKCQCYWPTELVDHDYVKVQFISEEVEQLFIKKRFTVTNNRVSIFRSYLSRVSLE